MGKKILDVCCGSKMFRCRKWENTTYRFCFMKEGGTPDEE